MVGMAHPISCMASQTLIDGPVQPPPLPGCTGGEGWKTCLQGNLPHYTTTRCLHTSLPQYTTTRCLRSSVPQYTTTRCLRASFSQYTTKRCLRASLSQYNTTRCLRASLNTPHHAVYVPPSLIGLHHHSGPCQLVTFPRRAVRWVVIMLRGDMTSHVCTSEVLYVIELTGYLWGATFRH